MDIMDVLMDRRKLEIARGRLANVQMEQTSLLDVASKAVLKYVLDGSIEAARLVSLPNRLRVHLMRGLESQMCLPGQQSIDEFERRYAAFESLLPAKKIDLLALMSYCPTDSGTRKRMFSKVMELIESKSPKVESLRMDLKRFTPRKCLFDTSSPLMRDLKNVKKLEMLGCNIRLADLMFLCREKMPSLQHVQVEEIAISLNDLFNEEHLVQCLSNLRVLLFKENNVFVASNDSSQTLFKTLCIDRLPNLKVFQQMADHTAGEESTVAFQIGDTVRPRLQHLTTALGVQGMHLMFPSVTNLRVDEMNEERDWCNMLQFAKIESLQICHSSSSAIEPFLARYGANLRTLVLSEMEGVLFRQIFKLCPNLEELKLQNVVVDDDTKFISGFAKLKRLSWKPIDSDESKKAHISNILAAPDLETLEMFGNSFNHRDFEKVSGLISNGQILRKLVTFKFVGSRPYVPLRDNDDAEFTDFFLATSKLIKNSMAFIPKLSNVCLCMCYGCVSWNNIEEGVQIEDMTPDPSFCQCMNAHVCKELKDETIFDFLDALKRRK